MAKKKKVMIGQATSKQRKKYSEKKAKEAAELKKIADEKEDLPPPVVPGALYWKLRLTTEAMEHEETRLKLHKKAKALHQIEVERDQLKVQSCDKAINRQNTELERSESEYTEVKQDIEKGIGISLNGKTIDPITYSVTEDR